MVTLKILAASGLILLGCSAAFAESHFSIQTGAFANEDEAVALATTLESDGHSPVQIRPEELAEKGLLYKVLVGDFVTRQDALDAKAVLEAGGVKGFVRSAENFDKAAVQAAISGTGVKPYFAATVSKSDVTTLTASLAAERKKILKGETTSSKTLRAYTSFVGALPDASTAKGHEAVMLGYYASFGRSAYKGETAEFTAAQALLQQVANGKVAATEKDRLKAQEMVAHHLLYYARDYTSALAAYRQILAKQLQVSNLPAVANARMEIAAASYELAKTSGFDRGQLQEEVSKLWAAAAAMQEPLLDDRETSGKDIRRYTARIGLMLTEILMEQHEWSEAKGVAEEIVSIYADYPECDAARAESFCHLANVGLHQNDKPLCDESIAEAIRLSQKVGPAWGDRGRDPFWKSYALKIVAARQFGDSAEVQEQIKNEMYQKFPNHPSLKNYFREEAK